MTDILTQKLRPSPDAFANAVGNETVLLQVKRGVYYGLDEIGTRIWEHLKSGEPALSACESIAAEFGVSLDVVKGDARAFLADLKSNEIIVAE